MSPDQRADLILDVVKLTPRDKLPVSLDDLAPFVQIAKLIGTVGKKSIASIPDVPDAFERVSIMLRMWSGCLMTGKTIAEGTRSGLNTEQIREQNARMIDEIAAQDKAFEAGIPAAIIIKIKKSEPYSFDGIPKGTRIYDLQTLVGMGLPPSIPAPLHLEPLPDDDWFFQTMREAIAENRQRENEADG